MNENNKSDALLRLVNKNFEKESRAKLRIFFGMSAGVGKTYSMLKAAHQAQNEGKNVLVAVIEAHGRIETEKLLLGLNSIPKKKLFYKEVELEELDIDKVLEIKPEIVLIDELAHTNIPGSRHNKRYQDVLEILNAGIDVYTTINVQHIESRKEIIEKFTNITVQETVPDSILDRADFIELIDITPNELIKRLKEGKVYLGDKAEEAQRNFFKEAPLNALREIALRLIAERVDRDVQELTQIGELQGPVNVNERLMVAVSHSPFSESLIRAARRIAFNLEAPWIAVNINTGKNLLPEAEIQLKKNIELAGKLGAEVITISDANVSNAISTIARQYNVTQIIIGRPTKFNFRDFLEGGSLVQRLIKELKEIDIHIVHQKQEKELKSNDFKISLKSFNSPLNHYLYSFIFVTILALISNSLKSFLGYQAIGFIFLLAVLFVSLSFNFGPILFTALVSSLIWDFFFIHPYGTFYILKAEDLMMCIAYFFVAAITGTLTNRIREQKRILKERGEKTQILYEISRTLASNVDIDVAILQVLSLLEKSFKGNFFIIKSFNNKLNLEDILGLKNSLNDKEIGVIKWVFEKNQLAGWSTDTLPLSIGLHTPLKTVQSCLGVLSFVPTNPGLLLKQEHLDFLHTISREIALALEKQQFEYKAAEVEKLQAYDKLHQALLSSISHELKTPLTTIIGTATTIINLKDFTQTRLMHNLLEELLASAEKLKYTVDNLLDMTRIQSNKLLIRKEWTDLRDLVNSIISKNQIPLKHHLIDFQCINDLKLIFVDSRLIEQAMKNIIINAANYSKRYTTIKINIWEKEDSAYISINDQGSGIALEEREKIFDKFYRIMGSPSGGTGLGLFISKQIFDLHGATINVTAGDDGIGSKFLISIPINQKDEISSFSY